MSSYSTKTGPNAVATYGPSPIGSWPSRAQPFVEGGRKVRILELVRFAALCDDLQPAPSGEVPGEEIIEVFLEFDELLGRVARRRLEQPFRDVALGVVLQVEHLTVQGRVDGEQNAFER